MTHGQSSNNTFELYVHRNGGKYIGLCAELKEVIEGSTSDEIIVKTKALIDGVRNGMKTRKSRITVRVSPDLRNVPHT